MVQEESRIVYLYLDTGTRGRFKSEICVEFVRETEGTVQCERSPLHDDTVAWYPSVRDIERYWGILNSNLFDEAGQVGCKLFYTTEDLRIILFLITRVLNIVIEKVRILLLTTDRDSRQHFLLVVFAALRQKCLELSVVLVGGNTEIDEEHSRQASHHHSLHNNSKVDLHVFPYCK